MSELVGSWRYGRGGETWSVQIRSAFGGKYPGLIQKHESIHQRINSSTPDGVILSTACRLGETADKGRISIPRSAEIIGQLQSGAKKSHERAATFLSLRSHPPHERDEFLSVVSREYGDYYREMAAVADRVTGEESAQKILIWALTVASFSSRLVVHCCGRDWNDWPGREYESPDDRFDRMVRWFDVPGNPERLGGLLTSIMGGGPAGPVEAALFDSVFSLVPFESGVKLIEGPDRSAAYSELSKRLTAIGLGWNLIKTDDADPAETDRGFGTVQMLNQLDSRMTNHGARRLGWTPAGHLPSADASPASILFACEYLFETDPSWIVMERGRDPSGPRLALGRFADSNAVGLMRTIDARAAAGLATRKVEVILAALPSLNERARALTTILGDTLRSVIRNRLVWYAAGDFMTWATDLARETPFRYAVYPFTPVNDRPTGEFAEIRESTMAAVVCWWPDKPDLFLRVFDPSSSVAAIKLLQIMERDQYAQSAADGETQFYRGIVVSALQLQSLVWRNF